MSGTNDGRAQRLKAALRDNLRRRKAQERARTPGEPGASGEPDRQEGEAPPDDRGGNAPDSDKSRL